jgi:asparagine synthase (glutamine-hydrolysing)
MCGIAGFFLPDGCAKIQAPLTPMLNVMRHRGPDGEEVFNSDDGQFQAGFLRLAIIDMETGDQPFLSPDEKNVLLGNGEIYNYLDLRKQETNYPFRSMGDMEVVLPLYAHYGKNMVDHLNGMFAISIYDKTKRQLMLVRDRLGIKPLYWAQLNGGGVIFASEIKSILASGLIQPEVDETSVSSYLAHGYVPSPMTLYRGISKLPPGHRMVVHNSGNIEIENYWEPNLAVTNPANENEITEQLTELLRDAVKLQLKSDVPLGVLLSGGIDSGLIVALAAEMSDQPINTYTVRFEGGGWDETQLAKSVADRYGTRHQIIDIGIQNINEHLPSVAWYCDEPISDPALLPNYLVEKALSQNLKVALNGTGGDELFAGYGRYFLTDIEKKYLHLPASLRHKVIEPTINSFSPMTEWKLARAEKYSNERGSYLHDHCALFPQPMRTRIGNLQQIESARQQDFYATASAPPQSAALYADIKTYLAENLLTLLDRSSMGVSVEGRVPLLDHRLVEAALKVPPEIRTMGGQQKSLERKIARQYLPDAVLNAPKRGFASPVPAWMENGLATLSKRILTRPEALDRGWWTQDGIDHLANNSARHGFRLYSLLMLELCVRIHIEGPSGDLPPLDSLETYA